MLKKLFLVIFPLLLVFGCMNTPVKEDASKDQEKPEYATARPPVTVRDELTVVFSEQDVELDYRKSFLATEAQIYTGIYEGLFSYHPLSLEPVMASAEKWELSEDKKQWTFTLRRNIRFSNGDPVRAQDFRDGWISLLEPKRESPYSSLFDIIEGARDYRNGVLKNPEKVGITATDDRTLVVKLNSPASFFPAMLCHHSFSPIHPSMINVGDWSKKPPVSNGPFRIDSMKKGSIVLLRNENYWDARRVALKKITLKFTDTAEAASFLWNSGEARWIAGNVNLDALTDRSGIQFNVLFATHYYFIRSEEKPWNDYRLRRAMALVLPWDEIRNNHLLPAKTLIYPTTGYPAVEGISETNYKEAEKLMAEAGYAGGAGVPELVIRLTPSAEAANIGGIMALAWKEKLGLKVRVEVVPYERYFQSMKESGYIIGSTTWIGDFADPYTFLQMWRRDSNLNDAHYSDDDYEALIEKSMMEEGDKRLATLANAEKLLLERGTVLPISYSPALNIVDTNELDGWFPNVLDIHPFKFISFKTFRVLPGVVMATPPKNE